MMLYRSSNVEVTFMTITARPNAGAYRNRDGAPNQEGKSFPMRSRSCMQTPVAQKDDVMDIRLSLERRHSSTTQSTHRHWLAMWSRHELHKCLLIGHGLFDYL